MKVSFSSSSASTKACSSESTASSVNCVTNVPARKNTKLQLNLPGSAE